MSGDSTSDSAPQVRFLKPVRVYTHEACAGHSNGEGHPEQPARLLSAVNGITRLPEGFAEFHKAPIADLAPLVRAHAPGYVDNILDRIPVNGSARLDPDTSVVQESGEAALRAAGAIFAALEYSVAEGGSSFAAVRPPGHHAERDRSMGFCLFGSVGAAAIHAVEQLGMKRVAVVDFDVHHGNGTQDILWNSPDCLFVSSQQMPLYPGSGHAGETGAHDNVLNLPLADGDDGAVWRDTWLPALERIDKYQPDLILVSAGFDAHRDDPLAGLNMVEEDFAWLTMELVNIANAHARGRVVSALEGGYNLAALTTSVGAHVMELSKAYAG